jgi:hypothetical protein
MLKTEANAWRVIEHRKLDVNPDRFQEHTVTIGTLVNRYRETELSELRHSTANAYRSYLNHQIKPQWGEYPLSKVKPFAGGAMVKRLRPGSQNERAPARANGVANRRSSTSLNSISCSRNLTSLSAQWSLSTLLRACIAASFSPCSGGTGSGMNCLRQSHGREQTRSAWKGGAHRASAESGVVPLSAPRKLL